MYLVSFHNRETTQEQREDPQGTVKVKGAKPYRRNDDCKRDDAVRSFALAGETATLPVFLGVVEISIRHPVVEELHLAHGIRDHGGVRAGFSWLYITNSLKALMWFSTLDASDQPSDVPGHSRRPRLTV